MAVRCHNWSPKLQRRLQEFHPGKRLPSFRVHQPRDAACKVVIRFKIRENQFLRTLDSRGNRKQASVGADVDRLGVLLKRLILHTPVEQDPHCRRHSAAAALFNKRPCVRIFWLATKTE